MDIANAELVPPMVRPSISPVTTVPVVVFVKVKSIFRVAALVCAGVRRAATVDTASKQFLMSSPLSYPTTHCDQCPSEERRGRWQHRLEPHLDQMAAMAAAFFRFLRAARRPNAPRLPAKSGRVAYRAYFSISETRDTTDHSKMLCM